MEQMTSTSFTTTNTPPPSNTPAVGSVVHDPNAPAPVVTEPVAPPSGGLLGGEVTPADVVVSKPADSIWGDRQPQWPEGMDGEDWSGIKESPTLKNFVSEDGSLKTPQLLKALVNLDKLRGGDNVVQIPSKDATPEERGEFMKKALGFDHTDINSYELKDVGFEPETAQDVKEFLFDSKIPPSIADGIVEKMAVMRQSFADEWQTGINNEIETGVTELKTQWADAFDNKVAMAKKALHEIAPPEVLKTIQSDPIIANHPVLVKLMDKVATMMYQESVINQNSTSNFNMTRNQIEDKIAELRKNPAYFDGKDPSHMSVNRQVDELYAKLYS